MAREPSRVYLSSVSVVINSCALGLVAGRRRSSGSQPYYERLWLLRNVILPLYTQWRKDVFSEVIVVGEFEEGEGYTYVPCPSVHHSCVDALAQRQAGFEALKHPSIPWVLFQHDDHLFDPDNQIGNPERFDVLSPSRWTRGRSKDWERLSDGTFHSGRGMPQRIDWTPLGYLNGHACLMRPGVFRRGFNWTDAEKVFTWDTSVTECLRKIETPMRYAPEIKVYDLERNARPWL